MKPLCLIALALAHPAHAGPFELEVAWRTWMKQAGSDASTLAIIRDGQIIGQWGHLSDPHAAYPLASLSKAVTGACIMALVEDGRLSLDAPLSHIFANRPDILPDLKSAAAQITTAQLLTHTSGLNFDRTQTIFHPAWWGVMDGHDTLAAQSLTQIRGDTGFHYNNENYAILGSIIQQVSGGPVEDVCGQSVLGGLETARASGQFGSTLAYAGWEMSAADYARFADGLAPTPDWPIVTVAGGVYYGPGVDIEYWGEGDFISHSGSYCLPLTATKGSLFAQLPSGLTFVIIHDLCLTGYQYSDFYTTMIAAARVRP